MERFQIENLYKANGITDYKLKNTNDLLRAHGIDYKAVNGYNQLDDVNKLIYKKFIVNYYNVFGLELRATLVPKGIHYVEDIKYVVEKQDDEGAYQLAVGGVVKSIDKDGKKTILRKWKDKSYKQSEMLETESENYLRFEYVIKGRKEWQHVAGEDSWY